MTLEDDALAELTQTLSPIFSTAPHSIYVYKCSPYERIGSDKRAKQHNNIITTRLLNPRPTQPYPPHINHVNRDNDIIIGAENELEVE